MIKNLLVCCGVVLWMAGCATTPKYHVSTKPYTVMGETYYPVASSNGYVDVGMASWYGGKFNGRRTASGDIFNQNKMTAAHKTLPFGTRVRVTNIDNGKSVDVVINDRGPFAHGRIIDLSSGAAKKLGMIETGTARVRVTSL